MDDAMSDEGKTREFRSPALQRAYSWLVTIWIGYVLIAFFVIRILGSGLVQQVISHFRLRFLQ